MTAHAPASVPAGATRTPARLDTVTVLYIAGLGRSGSTLLADLLAQAAGVVNVGELRHLWLRGPVEDVLCTCGVPFSACPFWTAVGERAFGGWDEVDARELLELKDRVDRHRHLHRIVWSRLSGRPSDSIERYTAVLERLYEAIAHVSGCDVIVDPTKDPPHAFLLWRSALIDLRIVHLIRDSRAVAYSWSKRVRRPEVVDGDAFMDQASAGKIAWKWNDYNLLFEALRRMRVPSISIRYEAFVGAPAHHAARALSLVADRGVTGRPAVSQDRVFHRSSGHALSGNPGRFQRGPVEIRRDDAWRRQLPRRQFLAVSAITLPMLLRYGYRLSRRLPTEKEHGAR